MHTVSIGFESCNEGEVEDSCGESNPVSQNESSRTSAFFLGHFLGIWSVALLGLSNLPFMMESMHFLLAVLHSKRAAALLMIGGF